MNSKLYCINPNTKEYEEVKTICGINIEEILDLIRDYKMSKDLKFDMFGKLEEIERLKQDNEYLNKVNIELSSRNSKAIEYIETHQLNFKKNITTFGSERLSMEERKLLDILRGVDKE